MRKTTIVLGAALGGFLPGCVPQFADDLSQVEGFRVLAVRADPAEAPPGGQVTLSALWATPEGETVEASDVTWALCTKRRELTEPGPVSPVCLAEFEDGESENLEYLESGESAAASLPRDVCRYFGPLASPPEPGSVVGGRPADPDLTGGYYQPVLVGQDEATLGTIRLLCGATNLPLTEIRNFNQGYRPNEHPDFESILRRSDDSSEEIDPAQTLEVGRGQEVDFRVEWSSCPEEPECGDGLCTPGENSTNCSEDCRTDPVGCTGAEFYLYADPATRTVTTQRETVTVAWFTTGGSFASSSTDDPEGNDFTENVWTAPDEPGTLNIWLVLRDNRGGVSWRTLEVEVE